MARGRKRIDEQTRARWEEGFCAHIAETVESHRRASERVPRRDGTAPPPSLGPDFVQMSTIPNLPPSIAMPLSALQRKMLWAAWQGELHRNGNGISIAGHRASVVTLRALRQRGLVEKGGGQIGITQDGLVALELLYTDPREWSTPIEAVTGTIQRTVYSERVD
jgi:hypothetical protein